MLFTDDDLIDEFEKRNLPLNRRVLTDWRSKGYLEPLQVKGKGRGRGKVYFSSRNVLNRALLVDEALRLDYRGRRILFILWLFGYDIPSGSVRDHVLSALNKLQKIAGGDSKDSRAISEHIESVVLEYYQIAEKHRQLNLPRELPDVGMEMILNVFANSDYDLGSIAFEEGIEAVLTTFRENEVKALGEPVARLQHAKNTWRYVHENFSLQQIHSAVIAAGDEDFRRVQADIGLIFKVIAKRASGRSDLKSIHDFRLLAAYGFGMLLVPINLTLRRQGWGASIDRYLATAVTKAADKQNQE